MWNMDASTRAGLAKRKSSCGRVPKTLCALKALTSTGIPRNPVGRTGMVGRGLLGRYGPNYAADPIVTRKKPSDPKVLQMVAITRRDTGELAIPGGMVEHGDTVSATLRKEFAEEALRFNEGNADMTLNIESELDAVFAKGGVQIYSGYVDDPRNTDDAWMESEVYHFHLDDVLGGKLPLAAGDDAVNVSWVDLTPDIRLYASHKEWVDVVCNRARMRGFGK